MKKTIVMLILAFIGLESESFAIIAQSPTKVIAFSGVKLRSSPELKSPVVSIVEFGEELELLDTVPGNVRIEWLEGVWVKARFEGREGYVFNGFLTNLPLPIEDYELTSKDADISYPIVSWVESNFNITAQADTLQGENYIKQTQYFENGITLTTREGMYAFEVRLYIPNIRLGDAYNLTRSMMLTKTEREVFEENSLFIKNMKNQIDKINISIDAPIRIVKINNGVEITVTSYQHVCGL